MDFLDKHPEFTPLKAGWCGLAANHSFLRDGRMATTPYSGAVKFTALLMQAKDNACELITVKDADHSCDWPDKQS
jgi:hypothetical protein